MKPIRSMEVIVSERNARRIKALLEQADRNFRLSRFHKAFELQEKARILGWNPHKRWFVIYPGGNVEGFGTQAEYDRAIAEHGAVDYEGGGT